MDNTRLEILDPKLRGKLRLYALLAPHMKGSGKNNSARWCGLDGRKPFDVQREDIDMSFGCTPDFTRRSVGYVGFSDGWQDLMDNFKMDWEFEQAEDGNIALMEEIDSSDGMEFTLAVGFGRTEHSASAHLLQAYATPFADQRQKYISQWQRTRAEVDLSAHTKDGGSMMRFSQCLLLAHEDKTFQGAFVASLSIPWGDTKDDSDRGGYHLVWTRDMVQTATALLACGQTESPLRALIWLACVQAAAADVLLDYADWLSAHLEEWTVTSRGELVKSKPRHDVRITPAEISKLPSKRFRRMTDTIDASIIQAEAKGRRPARLDLVFRGLGENGHTASLFPGTPVLEERQRWVAEVGVAGQDVSRVILTAILFTALWSWRFSSLARPRRQFWKRCSKVLKILVVCPLNSSAPRAVSCAG